MGIVNVTPDSFSDGGRYLDPGDALAHALELIEAGADILDIGGESSRPGAESVPLEEELRRVLPLVRELAPITKIPLSIDTVKPAVAEACLDAGARIVNDITGLRDAEMLRVTARARAAAVVMHMRGEPRTMQQAPVYADVVAEVTEFLRDRLAAARAAGIEDVAIDPGIGFGKTAAHNFAILRRLEEFSALGAPVLFGPSRKSFLGSLPGSTVGRTEPAQRLEGTIAAVVIAAIKGASVVRVHDVAACRRALQVVEAMQAQ
jgi:dihydropteroate synthase